MENVTHSLIGVLLGETIFRAQNHRKPSKNGASPAAESATRDSSVICAGILWASVIGNNLPDADFLMRPFVGSGGLGYLLHHRGYTHTFVMAVPLAFVAAAAGRLAARFSVRGKAVTTPFPAWKLLYFTGWLGICLHIGADFWNDYGVHPFWPFSNRWYYGDIIFIVEPLLWLVLLPFAYFSARSHWARGIYAFLGLLLIAAVGSLRYMSGSVALGVMLSGLIGFGLNRRFRSVKVGWIGLLTVLSLFAATSQLVRNRILSAVPPRETPLQLVSTPAPSNPLCWRIILTSSDGSNYRARLGVASLAPGGLSLGAANDPARCLTRFFAAPEILGPLGPVTEPALATSRSGVAWLGEFSLDESELRELAHSRCRIEAILRFVRAPYWARESAQTAILGDLRYYRGPGLGFADLVSQEGEDCPTWVPPWTPPSGLVRGASR